MVVQPGTWASIPSSGTLPLTRSVDSQNLSLPLEMRNFILKSVEKASELAF